MKYLENDGVIVLVKNDFNKKVIEKWLSGVSFPGMIKIKVDLGFYEYENDVIYIQESDRLDLLDNLYDGETNKMQVSFESVNDFINDSNLAEMSSFLKSKVKYYKL
ncbi:hypothetical protein E1N66_21655 [Pantoea allii]|nr:hypothetical protein [Pantoea allii]THB82310.1 hypothetical protein E1N66_21655 [Pantoea allii]